MAATAAVLPEGWQSWPLPAQQQLLKTLKAAARKRNASLRPQWKTPGDLARAVDPTTIQTPALALIDAALVEVAEGRCDRLIITMPPQEGKSTRVTTVGPLWLLTRDPDLRIAIACYAQDLADEFGRNIRNHIISNDGTDETLDLGLRIAPDNGAARRWRIDGHRGGVRSVGITSGLTGKPAEVLFIDDPIKDMRDADSKAWREVVWSFWQAVANTRLAPGAPVVVILTRWHEEDLAGKVLAAEDAHRWKVLNIPAQADHDPNKGETDPLGREPGEFMVSARGRSVEQWRQTQVAVGSRVWAALYQGRPAPAAGDIFLREWWQEYASPRWIVRDDGSHWAPNADEVAMSWDMAFKDTDGSDYVVGQVWARYGLELFLLDQVHDRLSFTDTCAALRQMAAKWPQATLKLVEDKANGTAVINSLSRQVPGLVPVEPDGSKEARARAVTPFIEAGSIYLPAPEVCPWVGSFIEEHSGFPNGSHDDQVDAATQAINRMLLAPILAGDLIFDVDDLDDDLTQSISPY